MSNPPPVDFSWPEADVENLLQALRNALLVGEIATGSGSELLARIISEITGSPNVLLTSSGTTALETIFRGMQIEGKRVLVQGNTFIATVAAVVRAGGTPLFVDVENEYCGLDLDATVDALERHKPSAVVATHIGGIVAPQLATIAELCRDRGISLVEDAAHALGSRTSRFAAGSLGDYAAVSLFATKVFTSGEGGAVLCGESHNFGRLRSIIDHGRSAHDAQTFTELATNARLSNIAAHMGCASLRRWPEIIAERTALAARYDALLEGAPVRIGRPSAGGVSNFYKYIVQLPKRISRASIKDKLAELGISLPGEVYPLPCYELPACRGIERAGSMPNALSFCSSHICLPVHRRVSVGDQERISGALRRSLL